MYRGHQLEKNNKNDLKQFYFHSDRISQANKCDKKQHYGLQNSIYLHKQNKKYNK